MTRVLTFVVGDVAAPEFQPARAWLRERTDAREVSESEYVEADASVIVFVQQRPGVFSAAELEATLRRYPFATVIQFLGPLCDGEARTGRVTPGVLRVTWKHWESELPSALIAGSKLPRTANEVERLLNPPRPQLRSLPAGAIGVYATSATAADTWADAIRSCGGTATIAPSLAPYVLRSFAALLIDLDGSHSAEVEARRLLQEAKTPLILLTAFLRVEEIAAWQERGAAAVLAKPFPLGQLEHALSLVAEFTSTKTNFSAA